MNSKPLFFSKYSGAGNDFILIDHRAPFLFSNPPISFFEIVPKLCHRQTGIGADGIILLELPTLGGDFKMRIFNADGSEAEMCGNGLRTLIKFIDSLGIKKKIYHIETFHSTKGHYHKGLIVDDDVLIEMPSPREIQWDLRLPINGSIYCVDFLDTGVPHTVIHVDSVEKTNIAKLGPLFRYHPHFPKGSNVNFVSRNENEGFSVRTYERGVEAETLACGTGAVATAISLAQKYKIPSPISLNVRTKDILKISFHRNENNFFERITLQGPAKKTFEGSFLIDDFSI